MACPHCDAINARDSAYCHQCHASLAGRTSAEREAHDAVDPGVFAPVLGSTVAATPDAFAALPDARDDLSASDPARPCDRTDPSPSLEATDKLAPAEPPASVVESALAADPFIERKRSGYRSAVVAESEPTVPRGAAANATVRRTVLIVLVVLAAMAGLSAYAYFHPHTIGGIAAMVPWSSRAHSNVAAQDTSFALPRPIDAGDAAKGPPAMLEPAPLWAIKTRSAPLTPAVGPGEHTRIAQAGPQSSAAPASRANARVKEAPTNRTSKVAADPKRAPAKPLTRQTAGATPFATKSTPNPQPANRILSTRPSEPAKTRRPTAPSSRPCTAEAMALGFCTGTAGW